MKSARIRFLPIIPRSCRAVRNSLRILAIGLVGCAFQLSFAGEFVPSSGTGGTPVVTDTTKPKQLNVIPTNENKSTIDTNAWNRKRVKTRKTEFPLKDSSLLIPKTFSFFRVDTNDYSPSFSNSSLLATDERSFADGWRRMPGIYSLHHGFYGQPAFAIAPHDPQGMKTEIFGRDNSNPISGFTPDDLLPVRGVSNVSGGPFSEEGNVVKIDPLIPTPRRAMMLVDYRDGFYALGRADFRFFQPLTTIDHWGFATSVSQADGRFRGAALDATTLLAHYRHTPIGKPAFALFGRQTTDHYGIAYYEENMRSIKRFDVDAILAKSLPGEIFVDSLLRDSLERNASPSLLPFSHWKLQGYWTRNQTRLFRLPVNEGRRLGVSGTVTNRIGSGEIVTSLRLEELRANLDQSLVPVQIQLEGKVSVSQNWLVPVRVTLSGIGTNQYKTEPQGKLAFDLPNTLFERTTVWSARSVRFPTIEELYQNDSLTQYSRSYDPVVLANSATKMYAGYEKLQPVKSWRGGFQLKKNFSSQTVTELFFTSVTETNPIATTIQLDTIYGSVYSPRNGDELKYNMAGFTFKSHPFGWGVIDATGTYVKYENEAPYYVPTVWGQCDIGTVGSYKRDALQWSAITRFRFIGEREWITTQGTTKKSARVPIDLLLSVQIYSLRINWGATNFFGENYEELPGFQAMHREEVWGIRWTLWD
ncbi:MAG: hypothetical protein OEM52_09915 [bacterium]|nr:hypothetical protein [bacterium]